jgi:hypothetical protein
MTKEGEELTPQQEAMFVNAADLERAGDRQLAIELYETLSKQLVGTQHATYARNCIDDLKQLQGMAAEAAQNPDERGKRVIRSLGRAYIGIGIIIAVIGFGSTVLLLFIGSALVLLGIAMHRFSPVAWYLALNFNILLTISAFIGTALRPVSLMPLWIIAGIASARYLFTYRYLFFGGEIPIWKGQCPACNDASTVQGVYVPGGVVKCPRCGENVVMDAVGSGPPLS